MDWTGKLFYDLYVPYIITVYLQLKEKNIVELYTFLLLNVLAIGYACVQVYQFRGFGHECDDITFVGWLALSNVRFYFTLHTYIIMYLLIHVHTHTSSYVHTHTHTLTHTQSLTHKHTHTHIHYHIHSNTLTITHTHSHSH